jgi:GNAT superfamily N-acetyltransferase
VPNSADIRIRRIRDRDGSLLRDLRIRSIADAPDAFGQSLKEAHARADAEWQRSATRSARGQSRIWLIAETADGTAGLVQGRRRRPATLLLFSMWVDPSVRRLGVGRRLVAALEAWATAWGARETVLWVLGANSEAIGFYRDLGFETITIGQDADSGARFGAIAMRRAIDLAEG